MISKIINDLYLFKFTTNTFADKKHENAVKNILIQNGLVEIDKDDKNFSSILKNRKNNLKTKDELKDCFFLLNNHLVHKNHQTLLFALLDLYYGSNVKVVKNLCGIPVIQKRMY